jgi:hypothetical protein
VQNGVLDLLARAVATHGEIVLLCFENVLEGQACHRRMLADWLHRSAGSSFPSSAATLRTARNRVRILL